MKQEGPTTRHYFHDLFEFSSGLSKPREEFGFGHPFLSFKDVFYSTFLEDDLTELANTTPDERRRCSVKRGDIFLTRTSETADELGKSTVALRDFPEATFNGFTKRLRPKPDVDYVCPEFMAYYLRSKFFRQQIDSMAVMTTRASLNNEMLGRLFVDLPPLEVQRAIAHILKTLDDKIRLNRKMKETLESTARALFKSWFIDFDPVRAKMEDRWKRGQSLLGISESLFEFFPNALVETEAGLIPKGWVPCSLYECARFVNGASFKTSDFNPAQQGRPVIKIAELKSGIDAQTKWSTRELGPDQTINSEDLLYSWSGSPETSLEAFVWIGPQGLLNQHIFKVVTKSESQKAFVFYLLKELRGVLVETAKNKQTTGLGHVTVQDMKQIKIAMPAPDMLEPLCVQLVGFFSRFISATKESRSLSEIRDTLLPKLLSGEMAIGDVKKFFKERGL